MNRILQALLVTGTTYLVGQISYELGFRHGWKKAPKTIFAHNTITSTSANTAAIHLTGDGTIRIPRGVHVIGS